MSFLKNAENLDMEVEDRVDTTTYNLAKDSLSAMQPNNSSEYSVRSSVIILVGQ